LLKINSYVSMVFSFFWIIMPKHVTEFGYEDPVESQNKWRMFYPRIKEHDPLWLDPPVKDSQIGLVGQDTTESTELYFREKPGVPTERWLNQLYANTPTIKHIYDNWNISKEHPGFSVQPYLYGPKGCLSTFNSPFTMPDTISRTFGKYIPFLRWSYFNGPFGTNCFEKTVSSARTMAYLWVPVWIMDVCFYRAVKGSWKEALLRYPKTGILPIGGAAIWSGVSCVACSFRGKDDWKNMAIGGVGVGIMYAAKHSVIRSSIIGACVAALTSGWRCFLDFEYGVFGKGSFRRQWILGDPLSSEYLTLETHWRDVPPRNW
ncbi:hypothetical protein T06_185, partial [Trichinella sp. T6]